MSFEDGFNHQCMYLLGIDLGSSSVKVHLLDGASGSAVATTQYPENELGIIALKPDWAEQNPETWWSCLKKACHQLIKQNNVDIDKIGAIGIAYQMHGLVMVDKELQPLRPSIIWCDSRAVGIGEQAYRDMGADYCLKHLLNSPANFTASKLKWVQENEPKVYQNTHKIMLPGDFIAMKLTGIPTTTACGLSEGIFWDFHEGSLSTNLMDYFGFSMDLIPALVPTFGEQGELSAEAAGELGLKKGIPLTYRAGDQPNNAFALNVLKSNEVAATAGTSGVIYAATEKHIADINGRVNTFKHVAEGHNGVLLCINGAGILYSWVRQLLQTGNQILTYPEMNELAAASPIGSKGLSCYPFGNGSERVFNNRNTGASFSQIDFNQHQQPEITRASLEGVAFAMAYGFEVLKTLGTGSNVVKAGKANLFLSPIFREAFVNTTGTSLELYNTDGAAGAARGAGLGVGYYKSTDEAFSSLSVATYLSPTTKASEEYSEAYENWKDKLARQDDTYH